MDYYSHYRKADDTYQLNRDHQQEVANLCEAMCGISFLKKTAYVTGLFHDNGKFTKEWQDYFLENCKKEEKSFSEKQDHSTLGGLIADSYVPGTIFADMVRTAVFMHHGLADCISVADGDSLAEKRKRKFSEDKISEIKKITEKEAAEGGQEFHRENDLQVLCEEAKEDIQKLAGTLKQLPKSKENKAVYGSVHFYLGMCERMLLSLLGDADVLDAAAFEQNNEDRNGLSDEERNLIWKEALEHLEQRLQKLKADPTCHSPLNKMREEISTSCKEAAYGNGKRFRLAVPTGAGKTLSSLRFALTKAVEEQKRHIFYVAPFRSILEQNASDIIEAIGNENWVLEHHGDVIFENEEENIRYERLIENWDEVPIIATTAVQFFNTLLKEKKRNLRRFHALCNSVIILDEVQAFPTKVMALFNLSVNFLTEICGSVVVLCTATQPLTENISANRMRKTMLMAQPLSVYEPHFRRTYYEDCSECGRNHWDVAETAAFMKDRSEAEKQVLAIFNTKEAARQVYEALKGQVQGKLFHLSTSMCAEHRNRVLQMIREALSKKERVTCISTQIVEAGWDVSFRCVIRSLAGLDNLIQAAGRCNRNGLADMGRVYLISLDESVERISSLPDISKAQQAMKEILRDYARNPERFGNRLDSEEMIQRYYISYLRQQTDLCYPVKELQTDLVDLLSSNSIYAKRGKYAIYLKQAFRTAGERFSLIEEKAGVDVVVPYREAEAILQALDGKIDWPVQKRLMRKLQRYIVNISEYTLRQMGKGAVFQREDGIMVLHNRFYCQETGIRKEPKEMELLSF